MSTEHDSSQEELTKDVSAPRAARSNAGLIIPRRELLTGAALAFVTSASGCKHDKPLPAGAGSCSDQQAPLRTPFLDAFTAKFIGDPTKIKAAGLPDNWPDPNRVWPSPTAPFPTSLEIYNQYATFLNALMTVGYVLGSPPAFTSGSLGDQIVQFLTAQNWPTSTTPPTGYTSVPLPTIHLIEISVIHDRLLQALNSYNPQNSPGGGGSSWPPH